MYQRPTTVTNDHKNLTATISKANKLNLKYQVTQRKLSQDKERVKKKKTKTVQRKGKRSKKEKKKKRNEKSIDAVKLKTK